MTGAHFVFLSKCSIFPSKWGHSRYSCLRKTSVRAESGLIQAEELSCVITFSSKIPKQNTLVYRFIKTDIGTKFCSVWKVSEILSAYVNTNYFHKVHWDNLKMVNYLDHFYKHSDYPEVRYQRSRFALTNN